MDARPDGGGTNGWSLGRCRGGGAGTRYQHRRREEADSSRFPAPDRKSVRVWLDDGRSEAGREAQVDSEVLVESLRDQVGYLRSQLDIRTEELREHRRIIAALTQRIPELEATASPEPPGGPERPAEGTVEPTSSEPVREAQEGAERRPWWRRMFGS